MADLDRVSRHLIHRKAHRPLSLFDVRTSFTRRSCMARRGLRAAIVVLGALIVQPVCAAENWPDSIDQYVLQIRKTLDTTDMNGYLAAVKNPDGALLLDVRDPDEFRAGHVPGTIHVSRGRLEQQIWRPLGYPGKVDMDRKIYVQCASGTRATLAAKQLKDIGFTNVTAVVMNLADWQKAGHPFVRGEAK
jgi:rhodanese-related sulfurtransferase